MQRKPQKKIYKPKRMVRDFEMLDEDGYAYEGEKYISRYVKKEAIIVFGRYNDYFKNVLSVVVEGKEYKLSEEKLFAAIDDLKGKELKTERFSCVIMSLGEEINLTREHIESSRKRGGMAIGARITGGEIKATIIVKPIPDPRDSDKPSKENDDDD